MIKILALFCLVCVVRGQYPCCSVPAWEAIEGFMVGSADMDTGKATETEGGSIVSYDQGRMMINSYIEQTTGTLKTKYRYLQDYSKNMSYHIDNTGCTKIPITTPFQPSCVPVGSKKVTSYYYGGSNDPLYVDVYKLPVLFGQNGYLTVTAARPPAAGCIPIGEGLFGRIGQSTSPQMTSLSFSNFTVGIKNATVFDIPPECNSAPSINMKPTNVGRFRRTVLF